MLGSTATVRALSPLRLRCEAVIPAFITCTGRSIGALYQGSEGSDKGSSTSQPLQLPHSHSATEWGCITLRLFTL